MPDLEVNLGEKKFTLAAGRISWCVTVAPSLVHNMWIITHIRTSGSLTVKSEKKPASQCLTVVSTYDTPSGNGLDSTIWIPTEKSVMQSADVANRMIRKYVSVGFQQRALIPQGVTILLLLSRVIVTLNFS